MEDRRNYVIIVKKDNHPSVTIQGTNWTAKDGKLLITDGERNVAVFSEWVGLYEISAE